MTDSEVEGAAARASFQVHYSRYKQKCVEDFETLEAAFRFAIHGEEAGELSANFITNAVGQIVADEDAIMKAWLARGLGN